LDLTDRATVSEVLALQSISYAVEVRLIGAFDIPPLRDTPETLRDCGETFYGYSIGDELVGAVSYKEDGEVLDIHRLVVRPDHFRRGIARSLVGYIANVATDAKRIIVSTGTKNEPACRLYRSLGFRKTGEVEPSPGLRITTFERCVPETGAS
jgi:ribosomal protein S18 acetylase RimI-like enzyme